MITPSSNQPLTLVVFGATGDLYQNKLSSALFNLFSLDFLPKEFRVVGFARRPLTDLDFRNFTREAITQKTKTYSKKKLDDFLLRLKYTQGDLENLSDFKKLSKQLAKDDEKHRKCSNKLFYLAVPPSMYGNIFQNISEVKLTIPCADETKGMEEAWTRVLVEKPFGKDLEDAKSLDKLLGELFNESQIFRIDHYLGKETLQNILFFRFTDGRLESIWDKEHIERVRIIFHEENTIFNRGAFYDGLGILRDVGQNHMLQMLALVAMENPAGMGVEKIRDARKAVLEKTILFPDKEIVRGQYQGYLSEKNVKADSQTETFFRLTLAVNDKRWQGVDFEMEAGKALDKSEVFIEVYFKEKNKVHTFSISSNDGVIQDAYQKVLQDCILGDQTIFITTAEIMAEWRVVTDIIKKWQSRPLMIYKKGSVAEDVI